MHSVILMTYQFRGRADMSAVCLGLMQLVPLYTTTLTDGHWLEAKIAVFFPRDHDFGTHLYRDHHLEEKS